MFRGEDERREGMSPSGGDFRSLHSELLSPWGVKKKKDRSKVSLWRRLSPFSVRRSDLCAHNPSLTPFNAQHDCSTRSLPSPARLVIIDPLLLLFFPLAVSLLCSLQRTFRHCPDGRVTFSESITQLVSMCSPRPLNWLNRSLHVHR